MMDASMNSVGGRLQHPRPLRGRGDHRPCDFCRLRKTRCLVRDLTLPCDRCQRSGRACTFNQEPPSRRRVQQQQQQQQTTASNAAASQHGSTPQMTSPRSLDTTMLGHSHLDLPEFASPNMIPDPSSSHTAIGPAACSNVMFDFSWDLFSAEGTDFNGNLPLSDEVTTYGISLSSPQSSPGGVLQNVSNNSIVVSPESVEASPTQDKGTIRDQYASYSTNHLGISSDMDPFLRTFYTFDEKNHFSSILRSFRLLGVQNKDVLVETPERVTDAIADLIMGRPDLALITTLEPFKEKLLALFDTFIGPFFPISISTQEALTSPPVAAAIYALALPWRSHDPTLPWSRFDTVSVTRLNAPNLSQLWQFVWQSICRELHAPSVTTVQACLLLMEREKSKTYISDSHFDWNLVTTSVSLAFSLGLHLDSQSWQISTKERSQRTQLWWNVYIQERWIAATMGRPVLIKDEDFSVSWPDSSDLTTTEPATSTYFQRLLSLTAILEDILKSFMTVKKSANLAARLDETLTIAKSLLDRLDDWDIEGNNYECGHEEILSSTTLPGTSGPLKVAMIYCYILIHRTLIKVCLGRPSFASAYRRGTEYTKRIESQLQRLTFLDFESFWYSWSRAQFNAISEYYILLYVVAPSVQEREIARATAGRHRQWLWLRSKSFGVSRMSMIRIDSLLSAINNGRMRMASLNKIP